MDDPYMPDLEFPVLSPDEPPRPERPRVPVPRKKRSPLWPIAGYIFAILVAYLLGRLGGLTYADAALAALGQDVAVADAALAALDQDVTVAEITAAQAVESTEFWMERAAETSETVEALSSEIASTTATIDSLKARILDLEESNAALKRKVEDAAPVIQPQKATKPAPAPKVQQVNTGSWSREQVASTLTAAAKYYGLSETRTAWIVETGCRVAYKESTYRPDARNGQYLGLFQFGDSWASESERLDPVWSCYRFVRVYADGGESKIRQHWAATI
jgi:hypothetical protein